MEQIYIPTLNYKVLVHTITYNQSKYITDTLDGVAMQQTNFPFVHYVIDDCSTDGEQEVIKSWLNEQCDMDKAEFIELELANVILVPHKKNLNLTYAIYFLKRNLWKEQIQKQYLAKPWREHSEYEALCEGDDYWNSPEKLQMQVDFLDSHQDFSGVATNGFYKDEIHNSIKDFSEGPERNIFLEEFLTKPRQFQTASVLYRTSFLHEDFYNLRNHYDVMIWCYLAESGPFHYFDKKTYVYRKNNVGVTISTPPYIWAKQMEGLKRDLFERYHDYFSNKNIENEVAWLYLDAASRYNERKEYGLPYFKCLAKSIYRIPKPTIYNAFMHLVKR